MNKILLFPQYHDSFRSFNHALRFISKEVAVKPPGLKKVSAIIHKTWQKKLGDMNVSTLKRYMEECATQLKSPSTFNKRKDSLEEIGYTFETGV